MTIKQLLKHLKKYPPTTELRIVIGDSDYYQIKEIEVTPVFEEDSYITFIGY